MEIWNFNVLCENILGDKFIRWDSNTYGTVITVCINRKITTRERDRLKDTLRKGIDLHIVLDDHFDVIVEVN